KMTLVIPEQSERIRVGRPAETRTSEQNRNGCAVIDAVEIDCVGNWTTRKDLRLVFQIIGSGGADVERAIIAEVNVVRRLEVDATQLQPAAVEEGAIGNPRDV